MRRLAISRTSLIGSALVALVFAGVSSAATTPGGLAGAGFNALDGHPVAAASPAAAPLTGAPAWEPGQGSGRPDLDLGGVNRTADGDVDGAGVATVEPLPLAKFAGGAARPAAAHGGFGVWDFVNKVRYNGLPEPASWALMLIGFGMIGGALRGFVVANRRLAGLQPEDGE